MVDIFLAILNIIQDTDPFVFYLIITMMVSAAALSYLRGLREGFISTAFLCAFFSLIGEFAPYVYIPLAASCVLFAIDLFGLNKFKRKIENIINWLYLFWMVKTTRVKANKK